MFENILRQDQVIDQLKADITGGALAPSVLFSGPGYSGKGTAALELARVLCCESESNRGSWNCPCSSCVRHRNMVSPDLLLLGRRRFFEECSASSDAFLRHPENAGTRMLFIRSIRKLLARFNGVLWEDDSRLGKVKVQIAVLEEELEDIGTENGKKDLTAKELEKKCEGIVKKAAKLEAEGLGEFVPIAQIRRAAYWSRMAPLGRHKCIIIENAESMQEGAKNSLLKILEEPPPRLSIILTSSRPRSLLPTMLSRLREYRFAKRNVDAEAEVISRIFRENQSFFSIESYLASFLSVNSATLYFVGAFFTASVAAEAVRALRTQRRGIPAVLADLGKFAAPIGEEGGLGRPAENVKSALEKVMGAAEGFETPGLFVRFLQQCSAVLSAWLRSGDADGTNIGAEKTACAGLWLRELKRTMTESDLFNINPFMALERLFEALKTGMT